VDATQAPATTATVPNPPDEELASRLRLVVTRLARRLRQEVDAGISPSMTSALATVERLGPLTPSELAETERIQRPTATRVIANLEAAGLVRREADPSDGRVSRVRTTAEGRRLMRRARTRKTAFLARRMRHLSDEERAVVEHAAEILERFLEDAR
jgi:DNA-binding MarR family transcriptional regulator